MPPNVEFLIAALDLLSGIVQGLGPKIEPLIAQTNPPLLALLGRCIHVSKRKFRSCLSKWIANDNK
jgi:transportin-1